MTHHTDYEAGKHFEREAADLRKRVAELEEEGERMIDKIGELHDRIAALTEKCTLYAASLEQADKELRIYKSAADAEARNADDWKAKHDALAAARQPVEAEPVAHISNAEQAREFLVRWQSAHFPTDRTFASYIRERLAGDFAWQLARALAAQQPATVDRDAVLEEAASQFIKGSVAAATIRALKGQPATTPAGEARDGYDDVIAAARKLVQCKGRYHTEMNYKALADALAAMAQQEKQG